MPDVTAHLGLLVGVTLHIQNFKQNGWVDPEDMLRSFAISVMSTQQF